ncbi:unnamed protein product [Discosporangium mesarthrocarpum]
MDTSRALGYEVPVLERKRSDDSLKKLRHRGRTGIVSPRATFSRVFTCFEGPPALCLGCLVLLFIWQCPSLRQAHVHNQADATRREPGITTIAPLQVPDIPLDPTELYRLLGQAEVLEAELLRKKRDLGLPLDADIFGAGASGNLREIFEAGSIPAQSESPSTLAQPAQGLPPSVLGVPGEPMFDENPLRQVIAADPYTVRRPVPLVVGGTDGSGTRGVVALLKRLGVPMVVEDGGTLDVHGSPYMSKKGWPGVVNPVLQWAQGTGYNSMDASKALRSSTLTAINSLHKTMSQAARSISVDAGQRAEYVSWGFKAPVSMMLVPFFAEAWGQHGFKFVHVVRDGRDIAFSGNQTPVGKYFTNTFPGKGQTPSELDTPLKAIKLWDKWNADLYEWARHNRGRLAGLDYLLLHTEDLLDPDAKFAAVKDVADFVGSPLSDNELCCIATEEATDMGTHTKSIQDRTRVVNKRFGKWKAKVEGNMKLKEALHSEGERGLRLLGYYPARSPRLTRYQCTERPPSCLAPPPQLAPGGSYHRKHVMVPPRSPEMQKVPKKVHDTKNCSGLSREVDFKGFDIKVGNEQDHLSCCNVCLKEVSNCTHFTFDYRSGNCYFKSGKGVTGYKAGLVSGAAVL